MNNYKDMEVLFIGPSCEYITKYARDFWKLSGEIRKDLGERGYYLDQYLSKVVEVLARIDLITVGGITDDVCWKVLADCYILCGTKEKKEKSEFFDISKNYIKNHNTNFINRHSKVQFYAGNILINHLNIFTEKVKHIYMKNVLSRIDYPVSNKMYEKISNIIGGERMEKFNDEMCEAFAFGPIMVSAAQQIVIRGLEMLCYVDPESSKKLYQFMLEGNL